MTRTLVFGQLARGAQLAPGALLAILAACPRPPPTPPPANREGISLAIYAGPNGKGFGIVEDRRTIEVVRGVAVLDRIDIKAELSSLVVESLDRDTLAISTCVRERLVEAGDAAPKPTTPTDTRAPNPTNPANPLKPSAAKPRAAEPMEPRGAAVAVMSPLVRCDVEARDGRYLVRVLYSSPRFAFDPRHDILVKGDTATIITRFSVPTPRWRIAGEVALFEGVPGGTDPVRELVRGPATLDGGITMLLATPRELPATVRIVFDGAVRHPEDDPKDAAWGNQSRPHVVHYLELAGELSRGDFHVHAERDGHVRDVPVRAEQRERSGTATRLPLWVDHELVGRRHRAKLLFEADAASDEVELAVSNQGDERREVWLEERLRPAKQRDLRPRVGAAPAIVGNVARTKLVLEPRSTARVAFIVDYMF